MIKTTLINGKEHAEKIFTHCAAIISKKSVKPHLVIFLVGDNPASVQYVSMKEKRAKEIGVSCTILKFEKAVSQKTISDLIIEMNQDPSVHGILLQLPLPDQLDAKKLLDLIAPEKDVDGLSSVSLGKILLGKPVFIPAVCKGILTLLSQEKIALSGKDITVIGNSSAFGMPLSVLLSQKGATVTICHHKTRHLEGKTRQADIIISAAGVPNLITGKMIKSSAIIIDGGITKDKNSNKIVGDVDLDSVMGIAAKVTPVPGGVGPMTIASLLEQTVIANESQSKIKKK